MTNKDAVARLQNSSIVSDQNTAINVLLDFLNTNNHADVAAAFQAAMQAYANSSSAYVPPVDPNTLNQ